MKVFLACLIGAALLGVVWQMALANALSGKFTFAGSPNTQAIIVSAILAFLGTLWGWMACATLKKKPAR